MNVQISAEEKNCSNDDYFAFMMISSAVRNTSLAICAVNAIIIPILLYSIIWYAKFGSDSKRTFINMMVKQICWTGIEYSCIIQITEILRYIWGPMPKLFCLFKTIARGYNTTEVMLYFDSISLSRYIFIFWLKNPAGFNDEFWCTFIYLWIKGMTKTSNIIFCLLAEHQLINYYICSGIDPTEDFKKPLKMYGIVEFGSVLLNIAIYIKIFIYKFKEPSEGGKRSIFLKNMYLLDIQKHSITSFSSDFISILGMALILISSAYLSVLKPQEIESHKILIFFHYLVLPGLAVYCFVSVYFVQHEPLRRVVWLETKELIQNIFVW
jgi:hypothetical protein